MTEQAVKRIAAKAEKRKYTRRKGVAAKKSKADEENALIARFISPTRNLVLWKEPIEEEVIGTRTRTKPGSGVAIEFNNGYYETKDQEIIVWLIEHSGFRRDFHPLPQSGDWWEAHEFFRKDSREVLSPTKKAKLRLDEKDKILNPLAKDMAAKMIQGPEMIKTIGT